MVRQREISRTAAFAWSPGAGLPMLATGTKAGAVDADFSDETKLEIWDLALEDTQQGGELQPIVSITTDSGFHDIAWAPASEVHPRGLIAGALDNGALHLWDVQKLLDKSEDALISQNTDHTTAISSVEFNPLKPQFLASVGAKGELFIHDVTDASNTSRLGNPQARPDDLKCVSWNRKVPHILATGSAAGVVTVWDIRTKKPSVILNNNRKSVGAIAWDPNNPTKLLTATPDDLAPIIYLWDLRSSSAPERELQGHQEGVLSLSWCQQDADLMLSCGKDNRTLCWNPQTGEQLGETTASTNWAMFQTSFHPHQPSLFATASLDGKISVYSIQSANQPAIQAAATETADGEDFFQMAPSQPQGPSFDLKKAPKWLQRPIGASFGFGGKLVIFSNFSGANGTERKTSVKISHFSADEDVAKATKEFEESLSSNNMVAICDSHIERAKTEDEIADWTVIKTLVSENSRSSVTEYLGFGDNTDAAKDAKEADISDVATDEDKAASTKDDDGSGFFEKTNNVDVDEDFLSKLPATKTARTNDPFELFADSDSQPDKEITRALMLGQFEKAMNVCLKEDRMADAFVIANCGGDDLFAKAQKAYFSQASNGPKYLRLLNAVIGKNLWDVVYNADLANWKETMAAICTYADPKEFSDLCEALGDRMLEAGSRKDASFCYIVGSKLEKVVDIWIVEFQEQEQAGFEDSSEVSNFSVHARTLQNFIEKVTVFRQVSKFQDTEHDLSAGWKLGALYDRYVEYADILASHGHLDTAEKYLNLLPTQFPAADITRSRVKQASKKPTAAAQTRKQQALPTKIAQRAQPSVGAFQPPATLPASASNVFSQPAPAATNPYAPPAQPFMSQSNYMPPAQGQSGFSSQGYPSAGGYGQPSPYGQFGAPPRTAAAPSVPPPSKAKDMTNWNDTPLVTKPAVSRRSTPMNAPPTASPFAPPVAGNLPPMGPPMGGPPRGTPTPPPPPPKASAVPRVSSPLNSMASSPFQQPSRPASTTNAYAPSPLQGSQSFAPPVPQPTIARGPSPYNPPPSGPPPSSRYAPAPASQQVNAQLPGQVAPPPQAGMRGPPPSNPYAPQQPMASSGPYAQTQAPPPGPPRQMTGPPRASTPSRPATGQSQAQAPKPAVSTPKYPPGDRSHIPSNAQEMVSILSNDMQRVAAKAPANFAPQVKDTQKRLNILFDHLNNGDLVKPDTVDELNELAKALQARNYDLASRMQVDIQREKMDECGNWMVGIKRLISMSKVTP